MNKKRKPLSDKLKEEDSHKNERIERIEKELGIMNKKYDNLKMARTITAASVDVDAARLRMSKMVREVDKCIDLVKK